MIEYQGYQIKPHSAIPTCYVVATAGKGGKIPDVMSGLFTSPTIVKQIIDRYLEDKATKDTKNGKEESKG